MNKFNYKILKGETLAIYHVWHDLDGNANDLTGWTGSMYIYDRNEALLAEVVVSCNDSGEVEGSADSSLWGQGSYSYYLRLTSPASKVVDLLEGSLTVE